MTKYKLVDLLFETGFGTSMSTVAQGIGRNRHSVNKDPYTWEDYDGMEYDISTDEAGKTYASIKDLASGEKQSFSRVFNDEDQAKMWVRTEFEKMHRRNMSKER